MRVTTNDAMTTAPIGVFDSGVGGFSILKSIHQLLPAENLIYVADSAYAPYGPKGEAFIQDRCETIVQFFLQHNAKAVVLACNTATAAAIARLRLDYALPFIGVEPAIKPAAAQSRSGVVGVLATSGTIASDKFISLQNQFSGQVKIITRACPGLVELIEQVEFDEPATKKLLQEFIAPMLAEGADTLVLGCTHYSLIRDLIQQIAGSGVIIIDAGSAVARELERRLLALTLVNAGPAAGEVKFLTSGDTRYQRVLMQKYWPDFLTVTSLLINS
jgi:glutamate racemase